MINVDVILNIAKDAGSIIMNHYHRNEFRVYKKDDNSPVTDVDYEANSFINAALKKEYPEIGIVSEENSKESNELNIKKEKVFIIDPLDGTRNFINGDKDFGVNIALKQNNKIIAGFVHMPESKTTYYSYQNKSYKQIEHNKSEIINVPQSDNNHNIDIATSRSSHKNPKLPIFVEQIKKAGFYVSNVCAYHACRKFITVLEGETQLLVSFDSICDWDLAPWEEIIKSAGGAVNYLNGEDVTYGNNIDCIQSNFLITNNKTLMDSIVALNIT